MIIFNIVTILAFIAGMILILHALFSEEEYPENGRLICIIFGILSVLLSFYMYLRPES